MIERPYVGLSALIRRSEITTHTARSETICTRLVEHSASCSAGPPHFMGSRPNPRELFIDATLGKSHIIIVLQVQPELRRAKRLAEAQRRMAVMKFPALAHLCICIRA